MGLPARFAANHPAVVAEMIDGEVVVIDLRSGNYFSLVESAAVIWASLAARPTHDEVAAYLGRVYDVEPERCFAVSGAFLDVLVAEGLAVSVDAAEARAEAPELPAVAGPMPEPRLEKFDDMQQLILLDPVHEIDESVGWPRMRPEETPDA
jgi:Coenzyme PQQ synthesis protein D (PqqD)